MLDTLKEIYENIKDAFGSGEERNETSQQLILARSLGEYYPLSIGTAMIFESEEAEINKWHKVVLCNIRTLIRNIYSSIPPVERESLAADDMLDVLIQEIELLKQLVPEVKPGSVAEFYLPDYDDIFRSFKRGQPRLMQTRKQKAEAMLFYKIIKRLEKRKEEKALSFEYRESNWQLERDNRTTTILTSFPSDLLSQYRFPKCNLLESHTGRVKERKEWSSKLSHTPNDPMSNIPFNKFMLTVFGDGVLFLVSNRKVKQMVVKMAVRERWSYLTTDASIRGGISKIPHPEDRKILLSYFD